MHLFLVFHVDNYTLNPIGITMETTQAWDKLDELKKRPELVDAPGYETEVLLKVVDSFYWFQLLME